MLAAGFRGSAASMRPPWWRRQGQGSVDEFDAGRGFRPPDDARPLGGVAAASVKDSKLKRLWKANEFVPDDPCACLADVANDHVERGRAVVEDATPPQKAPGAVAPPTRFRAGRSGRRTEGQGHAWESAACVSCGTGGSTRPPHQCARGPNSPKLVYDDTHSRAVSVITAAS